MSDAITAFLSTSPHGPPERLLALKGELPVPGGEAAAAKLCLTDGGVCLVAAAAGRGAVIDVSGGAFRWFSRFGRDHIEVGGVSLAVPLGDASKAQEILALGRLRALGEAGPSPDETRYIQRGPLLYEAYVCRALEGDEALLAWLPTASTQLMDSPVMEGAEGDVHFLLTSRRAALVAISPLGDVWRVSLPRLPIQSIKRLGRDSLAVGSHVFKPPLLGEGRFVELSQALTLDDELRMMEVARLLWRHQEGGMEPCRRLLDAVVARSGAPLARLSLAFVEAQGGEAPMRQATNSPEVVEVLAALTTEEGSGAQLAQWAEAWAVSSQDRGELVARLMEIEDAAGRPPAAALPLHESTHALRVSQEKDPAQLALMDIALAEHHLLAGNLSQAQHLLEARLAALPDEGLSDLLPPEEADLTAGFGGQALRIRILERLVEARGEVGEADLKATAELARLQPLVAERLRALIELEAGPLRRRARAVLEVLEGGALADLSPPARDIPLRPLAPSSVEGELQHPFAHSGGAVSMLQGWLGRARVPDRSALRAYSERLSAATYPVAAAAIADATLVLGLPAGLEAFVSRGEMSVGLRAYDGQPPFVLIGMDHLTQGTDHALGQAELLFALGAELSHLRLGHTRLTASEVWEGALHRGSSALDMVGAFLGPLGLVGKALSGLGNLGQLHAAGRFLQKHIGVVQAGADGVATVMGVGHKLKAWTGPSSAEKALPHRLEAEEELLAFCRSLQLTADRAGLVVCGDVKAATRAILRSSRAQRPVLEIARRHGLATALTRRGAGGALLEQDLAVRLAALFSFYLSEDYTRLRGAVTAAG